MCIVRLNCLEYKNNYEHSGITFMNILTSVLMPMSLSNVYQNEKKILLWHKNVIREINDSWWVISKTGKKIELFYQYEFQSHAV